MTEDQLAAIEARHHSAQWTLTPSSQISTCHAHADIPSLVAEVRRLQEAIDSACDKLDGVVGNVFSTGEHVTRLNHLAASAHAMWAEQDGESEGA